MTSLIQVRPDVDWQVSNGLFDYTVEFLADRLTDPAAAAELRLIVDAHFQVLRLFELAPQVQEEIRRLIRDELLAAGECELPDAGAREIAVAQLRKLVDLVH
jgi:hypothetical protein